MKIGINYIFFKKNYKGGIFTFSSGLVKGLESNLKDKDQLIFFSCYEPDLSELNSNYKVIKINKIYIFFYILLKFSTIFKIKIFSLFLSKIFFFNLKNKIEKECDIYYCPSSYLFPFNLNIKSVVSIHDLQYLKLKKNFSYYEFNLQKIFFYFSITKATSIQASSNFIKNDILNNFKVNSNKIIIINEGVDEKKFSRNTTIKESKKFFFYPAQVWPHKNHKYIIEAFNRAVKIDKNIRLIMTGYNFMKLDFSQHIKSKNIEYKGLVNQKELNYYYNCCEYVISGASYESSSLPILEGISMGKKILATDIGPNIELSKFFKINYFSLTNIKSFSRLIINLLNKNKSDYENDNNKIQIKKFYWKNIAKQYYKYFLQLNND